MPSFPQLQRREFLKQVGALAAVSVLSPSALEAAAANPPLAPSRSLLRPLPYAAVTLAPGTLEQQRKDTVAVLLSLTDDELLKPFRTRSGKDAPGTAIGGWYDAHAYCPGHTFGQWLSAFARSAAIENSPALRSRVSTLVEGLGRSFDSTGIFFGGDNRFPGYTLEKLNCGLIDALSFAGDSNAAAVLQQVNKLAQLYLPEKALSRAEQRKRSTRDATYSYDETYTLPENYFLAYQRTGNPYYRELGQKFMHTTFLEPLAQGENVLPGLHAYSHLNALNSAAQAYLVTGDDKALQAAVNGFAFVQQQSYASGGWGPNEAFVTPGRGELAQSLHNTHNSFETPCGAYGHFKLTRSLLSITGDGKYGDSMESILYNTILGSLPLQADGRSFYYSDYSRNARKVYIEARWPCCSGTLAQASCDYRINVYLQGPRGLFVNLYLPSTVRYQQQGSTVELQQSGSYPLESKVNFEVRPSRLTAFAVSFRIPAWAGNEVRLTINGKPHPLPTPVMGFSTLERRWGLHDQVTLEFPLGLRTQPIAPETPGTYALLRGPLLLYGLGPAAPVTEAALLASRQTSQERWTVVSAAGDRTLTTFDCIHDEPYSAYQSESA